MHTVESFGCDCFGNCTGWQVIRGRQVLAQFVASVYEPQAREDARRAAFALAARLNAAEDSARRAKDVIQHVLAD